jgi:hypothetical protein
MILRSEAEQHRTGPVLRFNTVASEPARPGRARLGMTLEPLLCSTALDRADVSWNTSSEVSLDGARNLDGARDGDVDDLLLEDAPRHRDRDAGCTRTKSRPYITFLDAFCTGNGP